MMKTIAFVGALTSFSLALAAPKEFGAKITRTDAISIEEALKKEPTETLLVKGPVEKVCKTMGCWMIMKSKDTAVRITFKDYGFVVNPTLLGKTAWVEGQLQKKNLTMEETRHLVKDEGGDPKSVKEPVTEWQLVAVGVKIP